MSLKQNVNQANPNAPHTAIVNIACQIMERLPDGRVTGIPVKSHGKVITINGKNRLECEQNLQQFLEKLT